MKKNIFAFIIAASLGFMSCEDFIEHEKRGVQDLDNYFKTDTECRDFVIDLYKRALLNNDWQPIAQRLPMMLGWEIPDNLLMDSVQLRNT